MTRNLFLTGAMAVLMTFGISSTAQQGPNDPPPEEEEGKGHVAPTYFDRQELQIGGFPETDPDVEHVFQIGVDTDWVFYPPDPFNPPTRSVCTRLWRKWNRNTFRKNNRAKNRTALRLINRAVNNSCEFGMSWTTNGETGPHDINQMFIAHTK